MSNPISEFIRSDKLGRWFGYLLVGLLLLVSLDVLWHLLGAWDLVGPEHKEPRTVTVSAEGKVTVIPDTTRINISVVTDGKTADEVQQKNTETMNKVLDYVKNTGVEAKDIKTTFYNLYPRYDYIEGRQIPAGFSLTQGVEIKVRDLKKVGEIVTGTVSRGANQVSGIEFFVDDPEAARAEARKQAFEKARAKAKEVAKLAGVRLGQVVTFSESISGEPPIFYPKALEFGLGGGGAPDTQPGSQEVAVNVNVVFEIK